MDIRLTGRVALITGGSKGLGLATARRMCASGADVAIVGRDEATLKEAEAEILADKPKGQVAAFSSDISKAADCNALYADVVKRFGKVDILVNNAGVHASGPFESITDEMWQADIDLKFMAAMRLSRLAFPDMKARQWGRILNTLNIFAKAPNARTNPTAVTRAATMTMGKALAAEGAPFNVLVNGLVVGIIESDQLRRGFKASGGNDYEAFLAGAAKQVGVPMGRVGRPEEFANIACFLASDAASYITGTTINVDGGWCPVT